MYGNVIEPRGLRSLQPWDFDCFGGILFIPTSAAFQYAQLCRPASEVITCSVASYIGMNTSVFWTYHTTVARITGFTTIVTL
jgi:hypothetical protein